MAACQVFAALARLLLAAWLASLVMGPAPETLSAGAVDHTPQMEGVGLAVEAADHDGLNAFAITDRVESALLRFHRFTMDARGTTRRDGTLSPPPSPSPTPSPSCTRYVAPTGSDENPGTLDGPWATPHKARDEATPGDTVCFRAGTYPLKQFVYFNRSAGRPDAPITYRSYPGETATFLYDVTIEPDWTESAAFFVARGYLRFEGLRFTSSPASRAALSDGKGAISVWAPGVEIRGNEIFGMTGQGVFGSEGADDLLVEGNHIHDIQPVNLEVAAPHGVYTYGQNQVIRNNLIHDLFFFCIKMAGDATGKVYRNTCHDAGEGITAQNGPALGLDVDVFNNVIWNITFHHSSAPGSGLDIYNGGRVRAYNNVIAYSNYGAFIKDTPNTPVLRNNIFFANNQHIRTWRGELDTDYNLFWPDGDQQFYSEARGFTGDLAGWQSLYGEGHSRAGDPRFAGLGRDALDYRLGAGSPAIDAGTPQGAPQEDFMGTLRPQGNGWDVGAYEFLAGQGSFADVSPNHWAYADIEKLFQDGFVAGCEATPVRKYCPDASLTRAEAAVFVERGVHGGGYLPPQPDSTPFDDVPLVEWFAKWVRALWEEGFTAGCGALPPVFCPSQSHTRAEATVFFLRMLHGADYLPPEPGELAYDDVARDRWYAKWVGAAHAAGLTVECEDAANRADRRFRPEEGITRAEAACMIVRASGLSP